MAVGKKQVKQGLSQETNEKGKQGQQKLRNRGTGRGNRCTGQRRSSGGRSYSACMLCMCTGLTSTAAHLAVLAHRHVQNSQPIGAVLPILGNTADAVALQAYEVGADDFCNAIACLHN